VWKVDVAEMRFSTHRICAIDGHLFAFIVYALQKGWLRKHTTNAAKKREKITAAKTYR
jgi:hypothetical protein